MTAKHEQKIQQSHAQKRWSCSLRVRGPHFASKVSYNAGAATDDYASQCKSPCGLMNLLVSSNIKGGQAMPRMKRWFACPPCFSMFFPARICSLLFPSEQRFEIFEVAFQQDADALCGHRRLGEIAAGGFAVGLQTDVS